MIIPESAPRQSLRFGPALACLGLAVGLAGCGGSEPEQVAVPTAAPSRPVAPSAPPRPSVVPVSQLMAELGIDERVVLPEEQAPPTTLERRAVLEFFDSFARGDAEVLGSMLSSLDRDELHELVDSSAWSTATGAIERIEVQTGTAPNGQACALAVFWMPDGFEPQLWYYQADDSGSTFEAVAAPPNLMDKLSGTDWIAAWFNVLDEELALADKPDEELTISKREVGDQSDRGSSSSSGRPDLPSAPSDPSRPSAPTGPGRREKGPKRAPPGKGR